MNTIDKLILREPVKKAFDSDNDKETMYALGFMTGYSIASSTVMQDEFALVLTTKEAFKTGDTIAYKQSIARLYSMIND